ncbi:MAG: protein jag [Oscillospiraceae bacterium]|nr:protein jag [Oscillospiraceae bacterium]
MKREVTVTAKTIEEAKETGAKQLGMSPDDLSLEIEILEMPKKGFLGIGGKSGYTVKVSCSMSKSDTAVKFLEKIIGHMKLNASVKITGETKDEIRMDITGENLGTLIGYHGEILDSLQYLTYLAVNKDSEGDLDSPDSDSVRILLDIENYRVKREETLKQLAKKMADRVIKYGRPVTLEPMNAYERRIIHAAIQEIGGIRTHSVGQENERRIVIAKDSKDGGRENDASSPKSFSAKRPGSYRDKNYRK